MNTDKIPYSQLIDSKFSELELPGADSTWDQMFQTLEAEMPRRKRTKFLLYWKRNATTIVLSTLGMIGLLGMGYTLQQKISAEQRLRSLSDAPSVSNQGNNSDSPVAIRPAAQDNLQSSVASIHTVGDNLVANAGTSA